MHVKIIIQIFSGHYLYGFGLKQFLEQHSGNFIIRINHVDKMKICQDAHIFIVDMSIGIESTKKLITRLKTKSISSTLQSKIILFISDMQNIFIQEMLNQGISGFVLKSLNDGPELLSAIEYCLKGKIYCSEEIKTAYFISSGLQGTFTQNGKLTNREKEILRFIAEGKTTDEISDKLCISKSTVETYRRRLFEKTGSVNSPSLVHYAYQRGILQVNDANENPDRNFMEKWD